MIVESNEYLRITIAKTLGWTIDYEPNGKSCELLNPAHEVVATGKRDWSSTEETLWHEMAHELPWWDDSLDDMHDLVNEMPDQFQNVFQDLLMDLCREKQCLIHHLNAEGWAQVWLDTWRRLNKKSK